MSQLSRLRRALPLAQWLPGAPGALQNFSTEGDAPRGRGRGRGFPPELGGPSAPGSSGRHEPPPPQQQQQQRGGAEKQAAAGPSGGQGEQRRRGGQGGVMSQIFQDSGRGSREGRPHTPRGGDGGGMRGGGGGGGGQQRPRRDGGAFGPPPGSVGRGGPLDVPALELFQSDFVVDITDEEGNKVPGQEPVPYQELLHQDPMQYVNQTRLPLLKYYLSEQEWQRFTAGAMDVEEQEEVADRLANAMLMSQEEAAKKDKRTKDLQSDPHYRIEDSLLSSAMPRGRALGGGVAMQEGEQHQQQHLGARAEAEAVLDSMKEDIMQRLDLDEDEFEVVKVAAASSGRQLRAAARRRLPDYIGQAQQLQAMVDEAVPAAHPMRDVVQEQVSVLAGNPGWPHERKVVYVKRLIRRFAGNEAQMHS